MSNEYLEQLKHLSAEERVDNIGQIATVLALKEMTDVLERVVNTQEKQGNKLDSISDTLHTIDKRVTRVEDTEIKTKVEKDSSRLDALEKDIWGWKVRVWTIISATVVLWAVLGDTVQNWIGLVQ